MADRRGGLAHAVPSRLRSARPRPPPPPPTAPPPPGGRRRAGPPAAPAEPSSLTVTTSLNREVTDAKLGAVLSGPLPGPGVRYLAGVVSAGCRSCRPAWRPISAR